MCQSDMTELEVEMGPVTIRLRRSPQAVTTDGEPGEPSQAQSFSGAAEADHLITAPMLGTFYSAPTPGADPFVAEGDLVQVGQTIGIIEAMKIMNEITADRAGLVETLLVGNGQAVEYGSPLLRLRLAPGDRA
jgi:acetyl-CoA carboxylase biotin carboxyl carrier protein